MDVTGGAAGPVTGLAQGETLPEPRFDKVQRQKLIGAFGLDRAAYQVLSLIAPFLRGPSRTLLDRLSQGYL